MESSTNFYKSLSTATPGNQVYSATDSTTVFIHLR